MFKYSAILVAFVLLVARAEEQSTTEEIATTTISLANLILPDQKSSTESPVAVEVSSTTESIPEIKSYTFIQDPSLQVCGETNGNGTLVIALIPICPCDFAARNTIRRTWTNSNMLKNFKAVFVLGATSSNATLDAEVNFEANLYNDIIQVANIDTCKNISRIHKSLAGFKWVSDNCFNAQYVLKLKPQVAVNTLILVEKLKGLQAVQKNTFVCNRKNYGDKEQCDCSGYLFTADLAGKLVEQSREIKPNNEQREHEYISDLAESLKVDYVNWSQYYAQVENLTLVNTTQPIEDFLFVKAHGWQQFNFVWNHIMFTIKNLMLMSGKGAPQ